MQERTGKSSVGKMHPWRRMDEVKKKASVIREEQAVAKPEVHNISFI